MPITNHYDLDIDTTLGGNNASDYVVPSQKAIKAYVDNSTGGNVMWGNIAGNISNQTDLQDALDDKQDKLTIDAALSTTSTNPVQNKVITNALNGKQAILTAGTGISISSSTISATDPVLINNAAGSSNGVAIKGSGSIQSTQIGALGSASSMSTSVGFSSYASGSQSISIGHGSQATAAHSYSFGEQAKSTAKGAFQFGYGTNNEAGTVQFGLNTGDDNSDTVNYKLLGSDGIIPDARISSNIARTSQIPTVPTNISELNNDAGYITGITSSDVTTALGFTPYSASNPNNYTSNVGTVTSVNNTQPDSNGNVTLNIPDTSNLANKDLSNLSTTGNSKFQATLVSGTNIKTINNNSILGSGNLTLDGLPSQTGQSGKFLTTDGTDASWGNLPIATASTVGVVKPDNASIRVESDGTISAICRNVGEIISSTLPLTDAGLHLLDGSLLQYGIYKEFIDYIADLYAENPSANYFTTEALWQQSVTTYGVCGKFVYDSTNNTVRLPKITGIIEGTTDVTALGNLVEAGLPNITGNIKVASLVKSSNSTNLMDISKGGCFNDSYGQNLKTGDATTTSSTYFVEGQAMFKASRSSSIYGNSSTVQPQTIKVLYYIVIANSTKTEIEVDIDEIATDLNGKADRDGSNMVSSVKNFDGGWVVRWKSILSHVTCQGLTEYSYSLSSYLPDDGYNYEVMFYIYGSTGTSSGNGLYIWAGSDLIGHGTDTNNKFQVIRVRSQASKAQYGGSQFMLPVGTERTVYLYFSNETAASELYFAARMYRRIGTNS